VMPLLDGFNSPSLEHCMTVMCEQSRCNTGYIDSLQDKKERKEGRKVHNMSATHPHLSCRTPRIREASPQSMLDRLSAQRRV
jgi:hypothetical protein